MSATEYRRLRLAADYQFGRGAGHALFPDPSAIEVTHTSSGRPRQIHADDGRIGTYATDGRFVIGLAGGRRLCSAFESPGHRIVVGDESEPFIRDGRNVFAKFVQQADPELRPGDEVAVVHEAGDLLAVGRVELPGAGIGDFETGMAVHVRDSVER